MPFNASRFVAQKAEDMQKYADGEAVIATSGGVDSTVAAVLVKKAFGRKLHCVFVDTGLLRKGEAETAKLNFRKCGLDVKIVDASARFLGGLKGVGDPERKRKIIGELFIRVFEEEAKACKAKYLVQGTIAPDWIESGSGMRDNIKSHHNVGGLPKEMGLLLIEPLRDLYKDEVRLVAKELGVPSEVFSRQPFPGPGLAIRVMGEVTKERVDIVREACAIVEEELEAAAKARKMEIPWQYFAVLLPVKSVGVQGDVRAYGYTIAVRAVDAADGMTANYSAVPHEILHKISLRITNAMKDKVNRVVFDVTNKPPATIEWE
ncbi:GMP synthase [glutamine-hydrolyzing] subunit B [Candidatus Norongarragalina meridionalis]|nr:GMP synthase [glutamine-hydrolyzing] subunit B [Candidatus Norongarragalina meridionalis]